jgi:hypothetical protein
MEKHIAALEEMNMNLIGAKALAGFMNDYFMDATPNIKDMVARYHMYGDMQTVLNHLISDVMDAVEGIIEDVYDKQEYRKKAS